MVARRGHHPGTRHWRGVSRVVRLGAQRLGDGWHHTLSLRHAQFVCRKHSLSRPFGMVAVEAEAAPVGPRRHLLAHSRLLLAHNACGSARVRHVGLGVVHIHLGGGDSRNGEDLLLAQRAQHRRDRVLCGYGTERSRGFRPAPALCRRVGRVMDCGGGRVLHHGSCLLLSQQAALHAHRLPLLPWYIQWSCY